VTQDTAVRRPTDRELELIGMLHWVRQEGNLPPNWRERAEAAGFEETLMYIDNHVNKTYEDERFQKVTEVPPYVE